MNLAVTSMQTPAAGVTDPCAMPLFQQDISFVLKKKKNKKSCCEKYRRGKQCKSCPLRCCA